MKILELFQMMVKHNASDLHIKAGEPPVFRVAGQLARMQNVQPLSAEDTESLLGAIMDERAHGQMKEFGYCDFSHFIPEIGRFRCNCFRQLGVMSAAVRKVNLKIPTYSQLMLPPQISRISEFEQGLVLVGGVTGSGKSTTIASILNEINSKRRCHILTIEDPVEYMFIDDKAIVNQREIGLDVKDFKHALRSAVREDPDVMLVGEMRDAETFETALTAAETGHLVFGTVHSSGAAQTIGRLLDLFPPEKREQIRTSLAFNMRAVLNQKLLKGVSKEVPRVPAVEVMFVTPIIKKLILDGDDHKVADAIARDTENGCENFNKVLVRLVKEKKITADTALKAAPNAEELRMSMSGITVTDGGIV
jgi:twitching motility protein PilT